MKNTYRLEVVCKCPADGMPDVYAMTVEAARTIPVEDILAAAAKFSRSKLFQEDLCQKLHRSINAKVTLEGCHSGVFVVSECG